MTTTPNHHVAAFDPLDPPTLQCPHPWHQLLRSEAPVHFVADRNMWFVTSHELVAQALTNHTVFSSAFGLPQLPAPESVREQIAAIEQQGWPPVATLLTADPPEHHYYRRMVARSFTPASVAQLEPQTRKIARALVDQLPIGESVEVVNAFAVPLPLQVLAYFLNVPGDRTDDVKRWSDQFHATVGAELDDAGRLEQARNLLEFQLYFAAELDSRRARPRDDLLSALVATPAADSGDEPMGTGACLTIIQQLLIAGCETSTKLLTGALHQLALAPQRWEWLRERPTERSPSIVEESLRLLSPVQSMFRITTAETSLGGTTIPAGASVVLVFGSANRDETVIDNPDEFNPERANVRDHLAFGAGIHYCLGAPLARLMVRVALEELAGRFETLTLAHDNDFTYAPSFMLRGLNRLSTIFEPSKAWPRAGGERS